jgi:hypothetical protein
VTASGGLDSAQDGTARAQLSPPLPLSVPPSGENHGGAEDHLHASPLSTPFSGASQRGGWGTPKSGLQEAQMSTEGLRAREEDRGR